MTGQADDVLPDGQGDTPTTKIRQWTVSCRDPNGIERQITIYLHGRLIALVQPRDAAILTRVNVEDLYRALRDAVVASVSYGDQKNGVHR